MPPDLALLSNLTGSNYPCLELILMAQKVFEPLKFYCMYIYIIYLMMKEVLFKTDYFLTIGEL